MRLYVSYRLPTALNIIMYDEKVNVQTTGKVFTSLRLLKGTCHTRDYIIFSIGRPIYC